MNADLIAVSRGERKADILLRNVRLVNVLSGEVYPAHVAVFNGQVAGVGEYDALEVEDLDGQLLCPGFIDAHMHLESSMVEIPEFARAVVPKGTTAVFADPHEVANVMGLDGIRYILETSEGLPLRVFIMVPSCVPATNMETSGASLAAQDFSLLFNHPRVVGLGEMMNYPGVIFRVPEVLDKIVAAGTRPVDGHSPGLSGKDLAAYVSAGIGSDHEATTLAEAREKLQSGMQVFIRDGTTARNLDDLLPLVEPRNSARCSFCTDDRHPSDLLSEGSINYLVKRAIGRGLDPVIAIQMATINTARYFGIRNLGAVAPGYFADLIAFDSFENLNISRVYHAGKKVAENGHYLPGPSAGKKVTLRSSINVPWLKVDFTVPVPKDSATPPLIKIIGAQPGQLLTKKIVEPATVRNGFAVADPSRDILKIAVVERHQASGNVGIGFVRGLGMKSGAIASSVAHDSHNIVVIGASDEDMTVAIIEVARMRGGQAVVNNDDVLASLPLPIAGLMSDLPLEQVRDRIDRMTAAAHKLGCVLKDPLMAMSFLALPVIPDLKMTDKGLVDVLQFKIVPLFGE